MFILSWAYPSFQFGFCSSLLIPHALTRPNPTISLRWPVTSSHHFFTNTVSSARNILPNICQTFLPPKTCFKCHVFMKPFLITPPGEKRSRPQLPKEMCTSVGSNLLNFSCLLLLFLLFVKKSPRPAWSQM